MPNTITGLLVQIKKSLFDEKRRAENHRAAERKKAKAVLNRRLKREAKHDVKVIIEAFRQQGLAHRKLTEMTTPTPEGGRRRRRKYKIQDVRIAEAAYNEAAIFIRVDTRPGKLPYLMKIADIEDEETLRMVGSAVHRTVRFSYTPETGVWLIKDREGSSYRIPNEFKFGLALNHIKEATPVQPPLAVCFGAARDGQIIVHDLAKLYGLLVAGEIGSGKSVWLNGAILMILLRNGPQDVNFALIDMKGGTELGEYGGLPHLIAPVAKTPETAVALLVKLKDIFAERQTRLESRRCRDIKEWNRLYPQEKMPPIICVVDELAVLLKGHYDAKLRQAGTELLYQHLSTDRALGGYWICCTQTPRREIVDGSIKANLPARFCLGVASATDSQIVIGRSDAAHLEPAGRGAFKFGQTFHIVQSPYISGALIHRTLTAIRAGHGVVIPRKRHDLDSNDVFEWAMSNARTPNGAKLGWQDVYNAFKSRGLSQSQVREFLESLDGRTFTVRGLEYEVINGGPGAGGGRRLVRHMPTNEIAEPDEAAAK